MSEPIWPKASPERVNRALGAHSIVGVVLGALLYVLSLSGVLAVFESEIAWWEEPAAPQIAAMSPQAVDAAARAAAGMDMQPTSHLVVYLPTEKWPRAVAATDNASFSVDAAGAVVQPQQSPWHDFLIGLHYYLHLPSTFGFIFVGVLGAVMLTLIVSGLLAHPSIFRTAFAMRRDGSALTAETDVHTRLAVWTAPFQIAVAFTGAWIGLFALVGAVTAQIGYDGDRDAVVDTVFGWSIPEDQTPAALPNMEAAMRYMEETYPALRPTVLIVHEPGTAGQHMQVLAEHPQRLILGEYYNFDAAGAFQGVVGTAEGTLGQQIAMSMYPVHFGSFAGVEVRVLYVMLGLLLCAIIGTGGNIYLIKRARKGRPAPRLAAAWEAVVWGTPAALALTLLASVSGLLGAAQLGASFWIVFALLIAGAMAIARPGLATHVSRLVAALALLGALGMHGLAHGVGGPPAVIAISAAFLLAAVAMLAASVQAMFAARASGASQAT